MAADDKGHRSPRLPAMPRVALTVAEIMAILPATPARIADLTDGVTESQLHAVPRPGEWSISYILAHLRASSDVIGGCMLRIVNENHPAWRRLSPRAYISRTDYPDWQFAAALEAFTDRRRELLAALTPLPPRVWGKTAAVKISPTEVRARSLLFHGDWLARHEEEHLPQIAALARR